MTYSKNNNSLTEVVRSKSDCVGVVLLMTRNFYSVGGHMASANITHLKIRPLKCQ